MLGTERKIMNCGFHPPTVPGFVKTDPRGTAYGYFSVNVIPPPVMSGKSERIDVAKRDAEGRLTWACSFATAEMFERWAQDCT